MYTRYITLLIVILCSLFSCKKEDNRIKIAQVYDKVLYFDNIKDVIPKNINENDSVIIVQNKIDFWIKKQTMLKRAELALSDSQKNIEKIVEDYRASLLIEKFKQEYIKQNIDTLITNVGIEKYYNDYPESFKLNEEVVKALFFKVPINDSNFEAFKLAFNINNEQQLIEISNNNNEIKLYDFRETWVKISEIFNMLPNVITDASSLLKLSKKFQTRDENFSYFVIFKDFKLKAETIPLELASERIKIILLNKRKANLISKLEKSIYQSDLNNNNIKIFNKN